MPDRLLSAFICPPTSTLDASGAAGAYSALAGVLAGFAFVAVTFVLTNTQISRTRVSRQREMQSSENYLVVSLFCAFMALVVTAFEYSVIAGEHGGALTQGRASSETLLAGVAFVFGTGILVFAFTVLISDAGLEHTAREVRTLVAVILPALTVFLVMGSAEDVALTRLLADPSLCRHPAFASSVAVGTPWITAAVFLLSAGVALAARISLSDGQRKPPRWSKPWLHNLLPIGSLIVVLAAAFGAALLSEDDPSQSLTDLGVWVWVGITAVGMTLQAAVSLWTRPRESLLEPRGSREKVD